MADLTTQPSAVYVWLTEGGEMPPFDRKGDAADAVPLAVREHRPPTLGRVGRAADARARAENIRRLAVTAKQGIKQFNGFLDDLIGAALQECYLLEQQGEPDPQQPPPVSAEQIGAVVERVQEEQAKKRGGKRRRRTAE